MPESQRLYKKAANLKKLQTYFDLLLIIHHFLFLSLQCTKHGKPPKPFSNLGFLLSGKGLFLNRVPFIFSAFSELGQFDHDFLNWQSMEEMMHSLLCATYELEQTRIAAEEELRKRDERLGYLKNLLKHTLTERDEANERYQRFLIEKLLLQQKNAPLSAISSVEDERRRGVTSNNGFSSSESIVSSPTIDANPPLQLPPPLMAIDNVEFLPAKPLPAKGHLLEAVMKAGPLLQTLLLAGPLPQWRHPPPPLETFEIPPVTISSEIHIQSSPILTNGGIKKRFPGETSEPPS